MSKSFICNLTRCAALVLPVFLLSAQPILAFEGESVNSPGINKQQPAPENVLRITISKPNKFKPANNKLVLPQSGNRNYVYFNLNNRSSFIFTELYIRPSGTSTWISFNFVDGAIVPGETQIVTLVDNNTCYYDIFVRNSDGIYIEDYNRNFCSIGNYSLLN